MSNFETAYQYLRDLDQLRKNQETVLSKINKIHSKLVKTPPETAEQYGEKIWIKLRLLYGEAKAFADEEDRISTALITQIDTLPGQATHRKKSEGNEQKRKRVKAETDPSRLSSPCLTLRSPADHIVLVGGDQVAARISQDNADKDDWIVVKVTRFDRDTKWLEVIDEEPGDDEDSMPRKYKLPYACIIPFPKPSEPSSAPDFPTGSQVLAVYPGTTALYKATVAVHRKRKTDEYYALEFDDDEEEGVDGLPQRQVPFYHVVQLPEGHRQ